MLLLQRTDAQITGRKSVLEQTTRRLDEMRLRYNSLVAGCPRRFLSAVCKQYEKSRHSNAKAARHTIEKHIDNFDRLGDEVEEALQHIPDKNGECEARRRAVIVMHDVRTVVHWLEEVREAAIINPATVMVRFFSRAGFLFLMDN